VYFIFLCCRAGCACCRKEAGCGPQLSRLILFIMVVLMAGLTLCSYVGYVHFVAGVDGVVENLNSIKDTVTTLDTLAGDLSGYGETMSTAAPNTGCTTGVDQVIIEANTLGFSTAAAAFDAALLSPGDFSATLDIMRDTVAANVKIALAFVAALACVTAVFNIFGNMCKSSTFFNFSSLIGVLLLLLLIVLVGFEMSLSVYFADFCVANDDNNRAIRVMANSTLGGEPGRVVSYYLTCSGANPLNTHIDTATGALDDITTVTTHWDGGSATCSGTSAMNSMKTAIGSTSVEDSAYGTVSAITDAFDCSNIQPYYNELIQTALCQDVVVGLYELWATHIAAACLLYMALFFTSHVKQKCKVLVLMDEEGAIKAIPLGPPLAPHSV